MYRYFVHGAKANAGTRLSAYRHNGIEMPPQVVESRRIGFSKDVVYLLVAKTLLEVPATFKEGNSLPVLRASPLGLEQAMSA
jgi:hypothetical protein